MHRPVQSFDLQQATNMMKIAKPQCSFSCCSGDDVIMPNQLTLQTHDGNCGRSEANGDEMHGLRVSEITANE
jgi:hypothetical protein